MFGRSAADKVPKADLQFVQFLRERVILDPSNFAQGRLRTAQRRTQEDMRIVHSAITLWILRFAQNDSSLF